MNLKEWEAELNARQKLVKFHKHQLNFIHHQRKNLAEGKIDEVKEAERRVRNRISPFMRQMNQGISWVLGISLAETIRYAAFPNLPFENQGPALLLLSIYPFGKAAVKYRQGLKAARPYSKAVKDARALGLYAARGRTRLTSEQIRHNEETIDAFEKHLKEIHAHNLRELQRLKKLTPDQWKAELRRRDAEVRSMQSPDAHLLRPSERPKDDSLLRPAGTGEVEAEKLLRPRAQPEEDEEKQEIKPKTE